MPQPIDRRRFLTSAIAAAGAAALLPACGGSSPQAASDEPHVISAQASDWAGSKSTRIPISQASGQGPGRLRVDGTRIRITADAHAPSDRECFVLNSTADLADSEIVSTWYPTVSHGRLPQMGHVHRATEHGAIVLDQDVFASTTTWLAVWSWDGRTKIRIAPKSPATGATADLPVVVGWERPADIQRFVIVYVDQFGGVRAGDEIRIVGTGVPDLDGDRKVFGLFENAVHEASVTGPALVIEKPDDARTVPYTPIRGLVEFPGTTTRALYPCVVRSRVIGNLVQAKKWNARVAEPPWDPGVYRGGQSWALDLSGTPADRLPRTGRCGLLANHLQPGSHVDYDGVTITAL